MTCHSENLPPETQWPHCQFSLLVVEKLSLPKEPAEGCEGAHLPFTALDLIHWKISTYRLLICFNLLAESCFINISLTSSWNPHPYSSLFELRIIDRCLCRMIQWLCSCSHRLTRQEKAHGDVFGECAIPEPIPTSVFCCDCQVIPAEEGPFTALWLCCCGPLMKGARARSLQEINFSVGILCSEWGLARIIDWPRVWNSNSLFFLAEAMLQVHKRQQSVYIRNCQQYKAYCSCCFPWNKSTHREVTGCDKKKKIKKIEIAKS